jgi:hypothetical protein
LLEHVLLCLKYACHKLQWVAYALMLWLLLLAGCASLCFGGPLHKDLVVSTTDGSILLLSRSSNAGSSSNTSDVQVRHCLLVCACSMHLAAENQQLLNFS